MLSNDHPVEWQRETARQVTQAGFPNEQATPERRLIHPGPCSAGQWRSVRDLSRLGCSVVAAGRHTLLPPLRRRLWGNDGRVPSRMCCALAYMLTSAPALFPTRPMTNKAAHMNMGKHESLEGWQLPACGMHCAVLRWGPFNAHSMHAWMVGAPVWLSPSFPICSSRTIWQQGYEARALQGAAGPGCRPNPASRAGSHWGGSWEPPVHQAGR